MSSPSTRKFNTELHTPLKARIHSMYNDSGISKLDIAKILNQSKSTVQDALTRSVRRGQSTRGRSSVLSEFDIDAMIKLTTTNFLTRVYTWKGLAVAIGRDDVCEATARKVMHSRGFKKCKACRHPYVTSATALKRLFWTKTENRWRQKLKYWMN